MTLGTNLNRGNEINHLEDDQTHISRDYDHISDLIQAGQIYAVVSPKKMNGVLTIGWHVA